MMSGVRRSHALALAGGAALLLLLLARLPPAPAPAPAPRLLPRRHDAAEHTSLAYVSAAAGSASPSTAAANSTSPAAPPSPAAATAAAPAASSASTKPRVVLTKELYAAGHAVAHPELCARLGAGLRLVVGVTSAPAHAAARQGVRLTWGHYAGRRDMALAFVLGRPPPALADAIAAEDALYGDLVIGNSVDSYSNLTLKTLSLLEWVDTYCPRAAAVLKTDDDMFINVPRLLAFLAARPRATRTVWGKVLRKALPMRTAKSKYFLSEAQYPARVFPPFATGPAYVLTADCVRPLLAAAPAQPYVRLEDVFVTGLLAARLGLKRTHAPEFYNKKVSPHPCAVQRGVAIHMVRYHEQFDLWRKLLDGRTRCS